MKEWNVVKCQESTESQSKYSPNIPTQQDSENQKLIETLQKNFTLSKCSETNNQRSSKNQPQLTPNISFDPYVKNPLSNQEPMMNTKRYSPDLSSQGNQSQLHNHNASDVPNQVPNEQYQFGNKLPNGSSCINVSTYASVTQPAPPVLNPVMMQTQMQSTFLNSNEPIMTTEPNGNRLPVVKVNVPPSTVPQNGSTEDKSSQELPAIAEDQHAESTNKIPAKQDVGELPARQKSPIEQLQILATNPIETHQSLKSKSSDSTFKIKNSPEARASSTSSNGSPSTERLNPVYLKAPDSNGVNAITTGLPDMYQASVPKSMPLIFNNGSRFPNICGSITTTTNSVSSPIAQRPSLQSAEASLSPVFYPNSNAIQSFPFQTTQINGVPSQCYPPISQCMNPVIFVSDPCTYPRYPVMNMQPLTLPSR
ncbi:hypothetical protein TNCV_4021031 [Trichonephila clavipes]|nr:hypothetical protein TNCV_4021031 [Trichonephila clavipes]